MSAPERLAVLITGATGPAGRATARRFAADGQLVALNGLDADRLTTTIRELGLSPDASLTVAGDLTDPAAARSVVERVVETFGRVDIVAHLVGGYAGGTAVADLDHDEVRRMLDQHLWTTLNVLQAVVPGMRERGFGRVVAVSSQLAANPGRRGASYAMAKAAEEVLLRSLAKEAASDGITANVLAIRTLDDERSRTAQPNAKTAAWTTPEEVAEAIVWLASPAAAAVNGTRIPLDGRG